MNTSFTQQELRHYSRHFNLKEVGIEGQLKLKNARVLYIGAGGLGSAALHYLAAAGVGTIGIVDDDVVEVSNLQRQILYTYHDIQKSKVACAQQRLSQMNPAIHVITHALKLTHDNALSIIYDYDIIADGSDNFATRYLINDACYHLKKPLVYASISQFRGQCTVFNNQGSACYRCLFDSPPTNHVPNCAEGGVLGVLPGVTGTIQATEVIKLILNIGTCLSNRLLTFDALQMTFDELHYAKNPDCRLCHHQQSFDTLPHHQHSSCDLKSHQDEISVHELHQMISTQTEFILLDVREKYEYTICHLNGVLIPLNELPMRMHELDKNKLIVVYCKHGIRSRHAADYLKQFGFNHVSNLTGGIIAWIDKIDAEMARY